jgi:hypothetical protein
LPLSGHLAPIGSYARVILLALSDAFYACSLRSVVMAAQ